MMRTLPDLHGRPAPLGQCIGRGGEGAVFTVPTRAGLAAKIYTRPPDDQASRKLGAMVQLGTPELAACAAWPQDLLHDEATGSVVGFLMPRVEAHRPVHTLYGPVDRKAAFPDATFGLLVRTARRLSAALATVHGHGHVVGDVNQGNVVVSRQGEVRLIDCDSFQITHLGRRHPCRVGVPLFTPPELLGRRLDDVERTPDHDCFGLAVLVFHLLFMGRHPFAGRHPTRVVPVESAIREGLFAFGKAASRQGWEPPPFSLRLGDVTDECGALFELAFASRAAGGASRPPAAEWAAVLGDLEARLRPCDDDPRHVYPRRGEAACPFCRIENDGGPSFFNLAPGAAPDAFDLEVAWKAIDSVPPPVVDGTASPPGQAARGDLGRFPVWTRRVTAALGRLLRRPGLARAQAREGEACLRDLRALDAHSRSLSHPDRFFEKKEELQGARRAFEGLAAQEAREWEELAARHRPSGLQRHLEAFPLEFARAPGLERDDLAPVLAAGFVTAADLTPDRIARLPEGVPAYVVETLLVVVKQVAERSFVYDPAATIPLAEQKQLAEAQRARRESLVQKLQSGAFALAEVRREIRASRAVLKSARHLIRAKLAQIRLV